MDFPTDIISDIFIQLPVKSLLRFKSVSKPWRSLIEDPLFVKSHLEYTTETSRGFKVIARSRHSLVCSGDMDLPGPCCFKFLGLPTDKNNYGKDIVLIGSCNGLTCLRYLKNIIIWNISTGEFQNIELPRVDSKRKFINYGFGYDVVNDDYKVMFIVHHSSDIDKIKVYSLRKNTWKSIERKTLPDLTGGKSYGYRMSKGLLVGGALHWMTCWSVEEIKPKIFLFNLTTEEFDEAALPENTWCHIMGSFGGCLTTLHRYLEPQETFSLLNGGQQNPAKI